MKSLEQAKVAEALVATFVEHFVLQCEVASWEELPGKYSCRAQSSPPLGKGPGLATGGRRLVVMMDFNTPNSRDNIALKKLVPAIANLIRTQGAANCVVVALMATRAKEEADDEDPMEDKAAFAKAMRQVGFGVQQRFRQQLMPPAEEKQSCAQYDYWQDGRLMYLAKSLAEAAGKTTPATDKESERSGAPGLVSLAATGNFWLQFSELARTTRVQGVYSTPSNAELLRVMDATEELTDNWRADAKVRAAQRGVEDCCAVLTHGLWGRQEPLRSGAPGKGCWRPPAAPAWRRVLKHLT